MNPTSSCGANDSFWSSNSFSLFHPHPSWVFRVGKGRWGDLTLVSNFTTELGPGTSLLCQVCSGTAESGAGGPAFDFPRAEEQRLTCVLLPLVRAAMAGEQPEFGAAMAREEPELACQHAFTVSKASISRTEGPLWGGPADHRTSALPQPGAYLNHPPRLIKFSILSPCPKPALLSCPLPSPIYLPFVSSLSKGRKDGHPESRDLQSPGIESSIPAIQDSFDPGNMGSSQEGVSGLGTTLRIPPHCIVLLVGPQSSSQQPCALLTGPFYRQGDQGRVAQHDNGDLNLAVNVESIPKPLNWLLSEVLTLVLVVSLCPTHRDPSEFLFLFYHLRRSGLKGTEAGSLLGAVG